MEIENSAKLTDLGDAIAIDHVQLETVFKGQVFRRLASEKVFCHRFVIDNTLSDLGGLAFKILFVCISVTRITWTSPYP